MGRYNIQLLKTKEVAKLLGFSTPSPSFRSWCRRMNIEPVPGRRDVYDPVLVRMRLDEAQGLSSTGKSIKDLAASSEKSLALVEVHAIGSGYR